jgi:hypothetical protein
MSNTLKYLLFRIILVIITLHAVIPHPHSDELSAEKHFEIHQQTNSFIGIIRIVFHENNDENLDNLYYNTSPSLEGLNVNSTSTPVIALYVVPHNVEEKEVKLSLNDVINDYCKSTFFVRLNGLRGPPSIG